MTADGNEYYATVLGAKNKPSIDAGAAFEIVSAQTANAEA
jgi:hypothetical protein